MIMHCRNKVNEEVVAYNTPVRNDGKMSYLKPQQNALIKVRVPPGNPKLSLEETKSQGLDKSRPYRENVRFADKNREFIGNNFGYQRSPIPDNVVPSKYGDGY